MGGGEWGVGGGGWGVGGGGWGVEPFQISAFLPDCHCAKELDVARVGMD